MPYQTENNSRRIIQSDVAKALRSAVLPHQSIRGHTHRFYKYPARFPPSFASTCIEQFSSAGSVVLDPHMGGGTTIVQAMLMNRRTIGADLNSLAVFITKVKTTRLSEREKSAISDWSSNRVPCLRCDGEEVTIHRDVSNMDLPRARWIKKVIAQCLESIEKDLSSERAQDFARCVLLNAGQWALNGRRRMTTAAEFRSKVSALAQAMLHGITELTQDLDSLKSPWFQPFLVQSDVEVLSMNPDVTRQGPVDLVVTSPPYPGIHMLYHRWQVDGRKESNAPYWITSKADGQGESFYNFASRRRNAEDDYFEKVGRAFASIRRLMRPGAILAQMVAFSDQRRQLRRYLDVMAASGLREFLHHNNRRLWRDVPGRRWHAQTKGKLSSAREVVLLHEAV